MPTRWISSISLSPPTSSLLHSPIPKTTSFSFSGNNIPDHHKAPQNPRFLVLTTAAAAAQPTTTLEGNHSQLVCLAKTKVEDLVPTVRALPTSQQKLEILDKIQSDGAGFQTISVFNSLLAALVTAHEFELALQLISNVSSYDMAPDCRTYSLLLACYCSKYDPSGAKDVLDHMLGKGLQPNVATFTTLINSFCKSGRIQMAFEVFDIMSTIGCEPTINTYNCLLKGLCYVGKVEEAHHLLTKIKESSKKPDIYSYTAVMNGLCKVGRSNEALDLLHEALRLGLTPNVVTYNTLFNGYFKEGRPLDGIDLLKRMKETRCLPDYVTYSTLLHGLLKWGEIRAALYLYKEMEDVGVGVDGRMMNTLLRGLCRRAREEEDYLKDVYELFERMRSADCAICPLAHNMVIGAFCSGKEIDKALLNFREMIRIGTSPKSITFSNVVRVLCGKGKLDEAVALLDLMQSHATGVPASALFDILIDELNRHAMLVGANNVYGSALKRGVVPQRKPRATSSVTHRSKWLPRVEQRYRHGASHPQKRIWKVLKGT